MVEEETMVILPPKINHVGLVYVADYHLRSFLARPTELQIFCWVKCSTQVKIVRIINLSVNSGDGGDGGSGKYCCNGSEVWATTTGSSFILFSNLCSVVCP